MGNGLGIAEGFKRNVFDRALDLLRRTKCLATASLKTGEDFPLRIEDSKFVKTLREERKKQ